MDSITHTIIAWACIVIAYLVGSYFGEKRGSIIGATVVLEWVEEKVGSVQFNAWMKQDRDEQ